MGKRQTFLNNTEREIFLKLAEAALPAGKIFPGADSETVSKMENFIHRIGPAAHYGFRAALWALEVQALPRYGRPFSKLSSEKRLAMLESWQQGEVTRLWLRMLLTPLKAAHFNNPKMFEAIGCRYAVEPPAQIEEHRWQQNITSGTNLGQDEEMECDAVVVGTGAGGAPVAKELAERGYAVLLLEEGEYFTRKDFNGRPIEMQRKMYRNGGFTIAWGNSFFPIPAGKTVGGSTTINSGTCYRIPEKTLTRWRTELGLSEFTPEMLDPYYRKVEEILQVAPAKMEYVGGPGRVIARGCETLGYKNHKPLLRNAPECDGQGLCCFGCPTDAKRSTNVSYVPEALKNAAQLVTGVKVEKILTQGGKAVGVEGSIKHKDGKSTKLKVRAKVVVVSCGTFYTPPLLLKNNLCNSSGELGKNLSIHPASQVLALFDEEINGSRTIPQGYAVEEFANEGLMFEGAFVPLDIGASALTSFGPRYMDIVENYNHVSAFGFMVQDSSRGQVRLGPKGEPLLLYWLNQRDTKLMQRGMEILSRIYFAAGAKEVYPGLSGWETLRSTRDVDRMARAKVSARHFDITAYHPLGTARMGLDPDKSVVGPTHEAHDVRNLFICDGSAVPSSLGVNPQMTIMALATRASEFIARRLEKSYNAREAA
ncbi:MAG: GMC family oxidoreductase N-terminal domain-containing protein [Bdellovibrionota bacterium]